MNRSLYLKEGVKNTLSSTYGYELCSLVEKKLAKGDYKYLTDGYEDQDNTYVEVEIDSWDSLPYLDFLQFFFDLDDFDYNE